MHCHGRGGRQTLKGGNSVVSCSGTDAALPIARSTRLGRDGNWHDAVRLAD